MKLDPDLLLALVVVSSHGSFTKAAAALNLTQSTVSHQIRRLENLLGAQLLQRDVGAIRLTADGATVVAMAREILNLNSRITSLYSGRISRVRWRIGLSECIPTELALEIVNHAAARMPGMELSFEMGMSEPLRRGVDSGELDVALVGTTSQASAWRLLSKQPLVWAAAKKWRPSGTRPLPVILCVAPCVVREAAVESLRRHSVSWVEVVTVNTYDKVFDAARLALGVTVVRQDEAATHGLECLSEREGLPELPDMSMCLTHQAEARDAVWLANFIEKNWRLADREPSSLDTSWFNALPVFRPGAFESGGTRLMAPPRATLDNVSLRDLAALDTLSVNALRRRLRERPPVSH